MYKTGLAPNNMAHPRQVWGISKEKEVGLKYKFAMTSKFMSYKAEKTIEICSLIHFWSVQFICPKIGKWVGCCHASKFKPK